MWDDTKRVPEAAADPVPEAMTSVALPVSSIRPSGTPVQADRRKRFDVKALKDLSESIRQVGIVQPIVVREVSGDPTLTYEIVAGERRWLAAQEAGLTSVPAIVRPLTDAQVLLLQLVENIQREGLHPMTEAAGFEHLMKDHRYTVDMIAAKVSGEGKGYVVRRLKLLSLCRSAREAFSRGKLTLATALRLACVPAEVLQVKALKEITQSGHGGESMSDREAARHLQTNYMLGLAAAPFPTADVDLVAAAGPCGTCPKRTGNQPELFKDVQGKDVCTDPVCFQNKRAVWMSRQLQAAKSAGRTIIEGAAAKKIAPWGPHHLEGYVRPTDRCPEDPKHRTFRQLGGAKAATALLVLPETGDLIEVIDRKSLAPILKQRGIGTATAKGNDSEKARRARAKQESAFRWRLFEAIRAKSPSKLARQDLEEIALTTFGRHGFDARKRLLKVWQWDPKNPKAHDGLEHDAMAAKHLPKLTDPELARFLLDCVYVGELQVSPWSDGKPEGLLSAAQRLGVEVELIRQELTSEIQAQKAGRSTGGPKIPTQKRKSKD